MKRHFLTLATMLSIAVCCTKEQNIDVQGVVNDSYDLKLYANFEQDDATKVITEDGLSFSFVQNQDKIGIYLRTSLGTDSNIPFTAGAAVDGIVPFTKDRDSFLDFSSSGVTVYGYAPYEENGSSLNASIEATKASNEWDGKRVITLESEQHQQAIGNPVNVANYYKLVTKPVEPTQIEGSNNYEAELNFSGLFSLVKFGFLNHSGKDIIIKKVEFSSDDAPLAGKFNVDLTDSNPSIHNENYAGVSAIEGHVSDVVTVVIDEPTSLASGNESHAEVFAVVNPGTYASAVIKVYAVVEGTDVIFTKQVPSSLTFTRNTRAAVAVSLVDYEAVVSNVITNDDEFSAALKAISSNIDVNLSAGNYSQVILPVPNVNPTSGRGTSADPYFIKREIETLSIDGSSEARLNGLQIQCGYNVVYRNPAGNTDSPAFNEELVVEEHPSYYYIVKDVEIGTMTVNNITLTNAFEVYDANSSATSGNIKIGNIVLENVTFDMNGVTNSVAARVINKNADIDNITFKNCTFVNCANIDKPIAVDIRTTDDVNITVEGCTFDATNFNAMQLSGNGSNFTGTITIKDNEINNTVDRGIRISKATGNLVITGNTMVNATDSDGEAMKWAGPHTSLVFENNTLDGDDLEVVESGTNYIAKKVATTPDWAEVSTGVYEIYTKAGMFWFANQVNTNANTFKNQIVRLANNIDLKNEPWTPIGPSTAYDHEFQGTFDGNNKTISNLYCVNEGQTAGLFGYASIEKIGPNAEAYIKDVTIDHATVASHHYAGAVAAWVQGGYTVQNCKVTNSTITSTVENTGSAWDNGDKVGGVVGYIAQNRTTVTGCSIANSTVTGYRDLGGVVGCVATPDISYVTNNMVGENVKVVLDLNHSYKNLPSEIPCGSVVGRGASDNISSNTGTASITVKAYDTATAQLALDAAATARTIELAEGTYDELVVRHTKATTQITSGNHYNRTLENITLKAADGATVSVDGITINSGHVHTANASNPAINYVVKEEGQAITGTTNYNYYAYFYIRNFVIDGFNLTKNVYIGADSSQEHDRLFDADGITLQNCQMIGNEAKKLQENDNGNKLIRIGGCNKLADPLRIKNVVVRNCKAKQVFQGVYAYGPVDYTVENCEFDDLGHNVFQVGIGNHVFQNNIIRNCNSDRLFRGNYSGSLPSGDGVLIKNNQLFNTAGDSGNTTDPYFKGFGEGEITFEGNIMDGVAWNPME